MIKAYRHLYSKVEFSNLDGSPMGTAWMIDPDKLQGKPWYDHLTPRHRRFFDSLEHVQQLVISLSGDPFEGLRQMYMQTKGVK